MVISMQLSAIESVEKYASGNVCKPNSSVALFSTANSTHFNLLLLLLLFFSLFAFHALHIAHAFGLGEVIICSSADNVWSCNVQLSVQHIKWRWKSALAHTNRYLQCGKTNALQKYSARNSIKFLQQNTSNPQTK